MRFNEGFLSKNFGWKARPEAAKRLLADRDEVEASKPSVCLEFGGELKNFIFILQPILILL